MTEKLFLTILFESFTNNSDKNSFVTSLEGCTDIFNITIERSFIIIMFFIIVLLLFYYYNIIFIILFIIIFIINISLISAMIQKTELDFFTNSLISQSSILLCDKSHNLKWTNHKRSWSMLPLSIQKPIRIMSDISTHTSTLLQYIFFNRGRSRDSLAAAW